MAELLVKPRFYFADEPLMPLKNMAAMVLMDMGDRSSVDIVAMFRTGHLIQHQGHAWFWYILRTDARGNPYLIPEKLIRRKWFDENWWKYVDGIRRRDGKPAFTAEVEQKLKAYDFAVQLKRPLGAVGRSRTPITVAETAEGKDLWVLPLLDDVHALPVDLDRLEDEGWLKVKVDGKVLKKKQVVLESSLELTLARLRYRTRLLEGRLRQYATFMRNAALQYGLYDRARKLVLQHRQERFKRFWRDAPFNWQAQKFALEHHSNKTSMQVHPDLRRLFSFPYSLTLEALDHMAQDLATDVKPREKALRRKVDAAAKDLWALLQSDDLKRDLQVGLKGKLLDRRTYPHARVLLARYEKMLARPYVLLSRTGIAPEVYKSHVAPFFRSKQFKDAAGQADWIGKFAGQLPSVVEAYFALRSLKLARSVPDIQTTLTALADRYRQVGALDADEFKRISGWIDGSLGEKANAHYELEKVLSRKRKHLGDGVKSFGILMNALKIIQLANDDTTRKDVRTQVRAKFELAKEGITFGATLAELPALQKAKLFKVGAAATKVAPVLNITASTIDYGLAMDDLYNGQVDVDTGLLISEEQFASRYVCSVGKGAIAVGSVLTVIPVTAPIGLVVTAIGCALDLIGSLVDDTPQPTKEFLQFQGTIDALLSPASRIQDRNLAPLVKEANDRWLNKRRVKDFKCWRELESQVKSPGSIAKDELKDYAGKHARDVVMEYFGEARLALSYDGMS